ncbi:hypothetical protein ISN45_Aa08g005380 [Arabidopsis thaliana x Arabidopsis arenosa]|uniref:Uncharacterized protein n=1 Tax=Arabidopsis thaliana x Arabidopsis arenosa TaxID=1240361 RepID=A0A8T1XKS9_9BRAS|nr:hypothetical protein ISN45_Aa08g005380 [Arabidopsis thaliana x Arabidopsis arenosa]
MNWSRKIDDLHLSLNRFLAFHDRDSYSTLKYSVACVLHTHFQSYLVHRSISLRQLKQLAKLISLLKLFLEKLRIFFCNLIQFRVGLIQ